MNFNGGNEPLKNDGEIPGPANGSNQAKTVIKVENNDCPTNLGEPSRKQSCKRNSDLQLPEIGSRNSAFLPYKQHSSLTLLTNLQRGNVQCTHAKDVVPELLSFHERVAKGEVDVAEITELNVNALDQRGFTPLMWAAYHGRLSMCQALVNKGGVVDFGSAGGETALMMASTNGHAEIVSFLLNHGAPVDVADEHGNTALMYATVGNHAKCVTELLQRGASVTKTNHLDDSPFRMAVAKNLLAAQQAMEQFLKEYIEMHLVQQQQLPQPSQQLQNWAGELENGSIV